PQDAGWAHSGEWRAGVHFPAIKPIETAARAFHRLAHGADPKSSAPVAAAVIEDVDGAAGLWINDAIEHSGCRVVVGQSAPPGNQQSSTPARRKRAALFWRRPASEHSPP